MSLSLIGQAIGESATLKLNAKAALLKSQGEPVIHLGGGEPKSKAPKDAITAANSLLNTAEIRYTPADGTPELKKAIIKYTEEFYGRSVQPANVIVSGGAKQSIMVAMQAILNPNDEIMFPAPYWVSYPEMAKLVAANSVIVHPKENIYLPTIQDFEDNITDKTKCIIINSPNNPSGAMYSEKFISEIVEFCEKRDIWLMMDDIYHRLIFDGKKPISCYQFAKNLSETSKIIVINGVSKQYAMTGFRIGWAVGNKELVNCMTNIQSHQTSGPSSLSQKAAVGAINGDQSSVAELCSALEYNRNVLSELLDSIPNVKHHKPDGTFYCFVDFSAYFKDSRKLSEFLLENVKVVTVPGIEFGLDGFLRISTCGSTHDLKEGIERIRWALDPNAPKEFYIGVRKIVKDW